MTSKLVVPSKNSKLEVPGREKFVVIKEEHGIKLVEGEEGYMIMGKTIVYKNRSITWAQKRYERVVSVHENLDV